MRDRSVEARQESLPIIQYLMAVNSQLPSNRPSTQALSTLDGFLTQPLSYSYSLLRSATNWRETKNIDLSSKWATFSIVQAHQASIAIVSRLSGTTQNPEIDKPRSEPYFPIAIMA